MSSKRELTARVFASLGAARSRMVRDLRAGRRDPRRRRAVMITFDDGFRDNHDVALPVLRRRGVPAVFFVSTGYVGTRTVFWFDRIVHLFLRTPLRTVRLEAIDVDVNLGNGTLQPGAPLPRSSFHA